jgi:CheY-like chemotaxis protein
MMSAINAGSTFWFVVPLRPVKGEPAAIVDQRFRGKKALIADDRQINRQVLEHQLSTLGFACTVCSSGTEALELLAEERRYAWPDLVVLDMKMPGASSADVLRGMRAVAGLQGLPVVLLSSLSDVELTAADRSDPKLRALAKPVRFNELRQTIIELFTDPQTAKRLASVKQPAVSPLHGKAVLLVEDNKINRTMALAMLAPLGPKVVVAENGLEAVAAFERERFDLILMDCQMPVMDGFEATRRIRDLERAHGAPLAPIIAVTANAMAGDREHCLSHGFSAYIAKPFKRQTLLEIAATTMANGAATADPEPERARADTVMGSCGRTVSKPGAHHAPHLGQPRR